MKNKECIAMILAGGEGKRLGALTRYYSKPVVYFGGNYRIIDFSLSNCQKSGIDTIGILSQYFSTDLHIYINNIYDWKPEQEGVYTLTPQNGKSTYDGTADAVFKNIEFIDRMNPESVLILAGDHVYNMDYKEMIEFHQDTGADVTVAATPVPMDEASRFGIISAEKESGRVYRFEEKPRWPKGNLASMGIYVFKWDTLKKYLIRDNGSGQSQHDFGYNILPKMLSKGESFYMYQFNDYWRDVGTLDSLWEANMDQIVEPSPLRLETGQWGISNTYDSDMPNIISSKALVNQSIVAGNCSIFGKVDHCVLSDSVTIGPGSEVVNSVVMPGVYIGSHVKIRNAVIGTRAIIMDHVEIGSEDGSDFFKDSQICAKGISLIAPWLHIEGNVVIKKNSQISKEGLERFYNASAENSKYSIAN